MVQKEEKFCPNLNSWIRVYFIETIDLFSTGNKVKPTDVFVPLNGSANMYFDNEAMYNNTKISNSVLSKKYNSVVYHACRDAVASGMKRVPK